MSSLEAVHPDEGQLLAYADGELNSSETASVGTHVRACQGCHDRVAGLQVVVASYDEYHSGVLKAALAPPPEPWFDLRNRLREMDAEHVQKRRWPPAAYSLRWLAAAAAVVISVFVYRFSFEGTVNAAKLLEKASAREAASIAPRRNLRVKTRQALYVRPAVITNRAPRLAYARLDSRLRARFEAANYDWDNPLSARAFVKWRSTLPEKQDFVTVAGRSAARIFNVRTTTDAGTLAHATLTLRAVDLHPVRGRLEFRDSESVEIAESDEPLPETREKPQPVPSVTQSKGLDQPAEAPAGPAEELRVLAELNRIGADLGEPIDVQRQSNEIRVTGLGLPEARQRQVESALSGINGVDLRFEDPAPVRRDLLPPRTVDEEDEVESPVRKHLESRLGGRAMVEQFVNRVLDTSEAALARMHALRNLAQRFPAAIETQFQPRDRELLWSLRRQHAKFLLDHANRLSEILQPVFGSVEGQAATCTEWQKCTAELVRVSQDFDRLLNRMLTAEPGAPGGEEAFGAVRESFAQWHARVAAYHASFEPGL
jgi:hypothetical protein